MDYAGHFQREAAAFEAAARQAAGAEAAPAVPSCPGWVVTDLILHLGRKSRPRPRRRGTSASGEVARPPRAWGKEAFRLA